MRRFIAGGLLTAAFGTALTVASAAPASAQLARPQVFTQALAGNGQDLVTTVQYRRGWNGNRGYRGGGRHYHHGHGGGGAGIGLGIGLAAGAILGGAIAAQSAPGPGYYAEPVPSGDPVSYCMSRFRSYDPGSGTYLGFDGLRHPCP